MFMQQRATELFQTARQHRGVSGHAFSNATQTFRAVVHRIHAGHHSWQHLCGANIRSGFFAANVLLAGLQSQSVSCVAMRIHTHTHQAAGHGAFVVILACQISSMRATCTHGHAKALRVTHGYVSTQFAG